MFTPGFHIPGASTDQSSRRIVAFAHRNIGAASLEPEQLVEIMPAVRALSAQLARADVNATSTDKDVIVAEALNVAKSGGLARLNEFSLGRESARLSAGHIEDPHTYEFINKYALGKYFDSHSAEPVAALKQISGQLVAHQADEALNALTLVQVERRQQLPYFEEPKFDEPGWDENEWATSSLIRRLFSSNV